MQQQSESKLVEYQYTSREKPATFQDNVITAQLRAFLCFAGDFLDRYVLCIAFFCKNTNQNMT